MKSVEVNIEMLKEKILSSLSEVFDTEEYSCSFDNGYLSIKHLINNVVVCQISEDEITEELQSIKLEGEFLTIGEDFLNSIIQLDYDSKVQKINLTGSYKGSIEKKQQALGLILLNASFTIDIDKVIPTENQELDAILHDDFYVVTINRTDLYKYLQREIVSGEFDELILEVDKILYSLLVQVAYLHSLNFKNPRNSIIKSNDHFSEDVEILDVRFKKVKDSEPLLYFLAAEEMEYPHLKYLEYYHVLEYYFNYANIKKIDGIINDLVTIRLQSSGTLEDSYYDKFSTLMKYHNDQQQKKGEENRLIDILSNDIRYPLIATSNLVEDLSFLSKPLFGFQNTKINLSNVYNNRKFKEKVSEPDQAKFCEELGKRIYKIRNFIVHTKKYERENVFIPSQNNYAVLANDIKLIRGIAYLMITNYES